MPGRSPPSVCRSVAGATPSRWSCHKSQELRWQAQQPIDGHHGLTLTPAVALALALTLTLTLTAGRTLTLALALALALDIA